MRIPPVGTENIQSAPPRGTESVQSISFYNTESLQSLYLEEILMQKVSKKWEGFNSRIKA